MSEVKSTAITKSATGQAVTGPCTVRALGIRAGADVATVKFIDGTTPTNGPVRWSLGAGIGLSDGISFEESLRFDTGVYIVITGTTPDVHIAIENPQANQLNPS